MTITRRDFLNGTALTVAAGLAPGQLLGAPGAVTGNYPPALTGLRGNHAGTYTLAHSLAREGATYPGVLAREAYDLVVVGGGISGLAAAWFYQRRFGANRRILIVDNHDDFGGHAKRNEFTVRGRTLVTYGGSAEMPPSANDNAAVRTLLAGLGLAPTAQARALPGEDYERRGLGRAVFFDAGHFGRDQWLAGDPYGAMVDARARGASASTDALRDFLAKTPLPPTDRDALLRLAQGSTDFLAGMPADTRRTYLQSTRYAAFLRDKAGIGLAGLRFLRSRSQDAYALDADGISVAQAIAIGLPAGAGVPDPVVDARLGKSPASRQWFADGNATLARALVAQLVPGALPAGAKAVGDARIDYGKLDQDGNAVRIRLNSTAIAVEPDVRITRVTYGWQGNLQRVEAQHVIVAGYGMMVPFIVPTLPAPAKAALRSDVKAPLVYTKVALDNWRAFDTLKAWRIHAPTLAYSDLWLEPTAGGRDDPVVLHMLYVPTVPDSGMQARERFRAERAFLLGTPFDVLERDLRAQLDRMLAPGGFRAERDIRGITLNRWAHGYSYMPSPLVPDDAGLQAALDQAGLGVGNIRIAGADVAGSPSVTAAIDQAQRAVASLRTET
ncbi:FAD/NAD(P)-binding protein [Cupriavidus sp.]|uniref:FAD-dependent oxidoreductase n=1 Tax=Cupriavidus sp. TaxID=1873897 RepID=UPI0025BAD573|nr:FAD/NAD(P)-binding protein [Cupriavidus sp.]MCA3189637.1 NAD(P)/FAD-dependent oxidoreductase [Cupriavidus sp.]MCA3195725.1 NAD(P)/FAD-dependent oxidoreductase [Cupriavidus sp.]MCA3203882.1 NAD(P)/FAD-dependent oxidoreductase [Cupriavidus sp.]MCA3206157.1 NAD(P)/FAD-dependent oxidoreductase [Cupriavidus sp.]MCA3231180.1 NAD(P)/FAD-dependent oxidoreductase [Cupriavidus sp.]